MSGKGRAKARISLRLKKAAQRRKNRQGNKRTGGGLGAPQVLFWWACTDPSCGHHHAI